MSAPRPTIKIKSVWRPPALTVILTSSQIKQSLLRKKQQRQYRIAAIAVNMISQFDILLTV
jgi:hypothetical protein